MDPHNKLNVIQAYIKKMPSFPTTVTKIMEICNNANTTPSDLNQTIRLDPVLMGKIMQLINSAYYGFAEEITSLVRAIIMLGMNTVKNLALSTAILSGLKSRNRAHGLNMDEFWRHSLSVGVIAKIIAQKRNVQRSQLEEHFISGLLHDIGKIPLNNKFSDEYSLAINLADQAKKSLRISEKQSFAIDHTEVGKLIAQNWKLGQEISDVITYHHSLDTYQGDNNDILSTISIANFFANILNIGFSGDHNHEEISQETFQHMNIAPGYYEDIEGEVNKEIEKAQIFLKVAA